MKSIITNCLFFCALSLAMPCVLPAQADVPAITASVFSTKEGQLPAITNFTYTIRDKKIVLNWTTDKNQDADQFEIERSTDGKNFVMAALVFGTDKAGADNYYFFEKAPSKKIFYRIKIIQKDRSTGYSVTIPATREQKQSTNL